MNKDIAIIDPSSYSLPYDYFYIIELSKYYKIDFYYSFSKYNYEYIEKLKNNKNVNLKEYYISPPHATRVMGVINYLKMLKDIILSKNKYVKIHFIWNILYFIEIPFFVLIKDKLIFTFHNDAPHSYHKKVYFPYIIINKIAKKVIFVSNFTMKNFIKNYGEKENYFLLQHGVMPIDCISKSDNITQVENTIVFWGRVEKYKGVDLFEYFLNDYNIEIYGKWNSNLNDVKKRLVLKKNIIIVDEYLDCHRLSNLLSRETIYILPYKDATQSGVLYTFLAYGKVFISSDVGENKDFLISNGLSELVFDRGSERSIKDTIEYATNNYSKIKEKINKIKNTYAWNNIMHKDIIQKIYDE